MQMSTDFQHSFADRFPKTVYVYPLQKIPLLIQYVATLLCEMWLSDLPIRKFSNRPCLPIARSSQTTQTINGA